MTKIVQFSHTNTNSYVISFSLSRRVDTQLYACFLRLNNRRRTQTDKEFYNAGYYSATVPQGADADAKSWCKRQFGAHGFWYSPLSLFWFVNQQDKTLFQLTWAN